MPGAAATTLDDILGAEQQDRSQAECRVAPKQKGPSGQCATHPDGCLQLSHKLVIDPLRHLRVQLMEVLITVGESLIAVRKETDKGDQHPVSHLCVLSLRPG